VSRWFIRRVVARVGEACRAVLALPLYALSGWMPRSARKVVFGGNGDRFTDNAKYFFLHLTTDPRFECTWVTGDPAVVAQVRSSGRRAELRWSPRGVAASLRAGWFVYGAYPSDVNFWLSRGARLLDLWHGIPLKAIEFDITNGPLARVYRSAPWSPLRLAFLDRFRRPDAVVSSSRFLSERCFRSAFRLEADRCWEVGYPRTDHLFHPIDRDALAARFGLDVTARSAVIGYFPTWRDDGRDFLADASFSFEELDARLADSGRLLVFKAHPNFGDLVPRDRVWSNIVVLDPQIDLNEVLPLCDVLVTDYSSVAFDYLLLDRPIVYFLPDHDRYTGRRNLYFELDEMTAGPIITSSEELYEVLAAPVEDDAASRRRELRALLWEDYDGDACEEIAAVLSQREPSSRT
jgi:CDP-glycerol glycerophosphotransferase (TagB/SpsB family)